MGKVWDGSGREGGIRAGEVESRRGIKATWRDIKATWGHLSSDCAGLALLNRIGTFSFLVDGGSAARTQCRGWYNSWQVVGITG